ncbi:MAG: type IV pilus twitching motility protein PilT [bacterium]
MHINDLLQILLKEEASDLHIKAGNKPFIRVHGVMQTIEGVNRLAPENTRQIILSMMTPEQRDIFLRDWEHDFAYALENGTRFRVNAYHQRGSIAAVFRVIPARIRTIDELKLPPILKEFCMRPRGIVLVTGPTGSGKSTTQAAMIDHINENRREHIITIEDPIEFVHQNKQCLINQREVGADTNSFAGALKRALRQDPDIILVGEMRDLETIAMAITAAETGHLVLATLHTTGAAQTIDRIIDVFPPEQQQQIRMQVSSNIQGIICQILVPHVSGRGRVAAFEVMVPTPAMRNLIRDAKTYQVPSAMQISKVPGMFTLEQYLAELVRKRQVSKEAAYAKASDPDQLTEILKASKI